MALPDPDIYIKACEGSLETLLLMAKNEAVEEETRRAVRILPTVVAEFEKSKQPIPRLIILMGECDELPEGEKGAPDLDVVVVRRSDDSWYLTTVVCSQASIDKWAKVATTKGVAIAYTRTTIGQSLYVAGERRSVSQAEQPSVFSHHTFFDLDNAIAAYAKEVVAHSECGHLKQTWHTRSPKVLRGAPESFMRDSLWYFLKIRLRNHHVQREYTVKADKPVDICVTWLRSSRTAFIEVKWLGKALSKNKKMYSNGPKAAKEGAVQLRDRYVKRHLIEHPDLDLLGYLATFDARTNRSKPVVFGADLSQNAKLRLDHVMEMEPPSDA